MDPRQLPDRMQPARTTRDPRPGKRIPPKEEPRPAPPKPEVKEELLRELLQPFGLTIENLVVTDDQVVIMARRGERELVASAIAGQDKVLEVDLEALTRGGGRLPDFVPGAPTMTSTMEGLGLART